VQHAAGVAGQHPAVGQAHERALGRCGKAAGELVALGEAALDDGDMAAGRRAGQGLGKDFPPAWAASSPWRWTAIGGGILEESGPSASLAKGAEAPRQRPGERARQGAERWPLPGPVASCSPHDQIHRVLRQRLGCSIAR
jgi:hypothetical protein